MRYIYFTLIILFFCSCTKEIYDSISTDKYEIYEEFWTYVDEHYIFFEQKNVDWDSVYIEDQIKLARTKTDVELKDILENSLKLLKDGHNVLWTPLGESAVYNFKEGYELAFDLEVIRSNYIKDNLVEIDGFYHGLISERVSYIYIEKMSNIPRLRTLIREITDENTKALVLDIRHNGGGNSNHVPALLNDFVTEDQTLGYYVEKAGPGHNDKSDFLSIASTPSNHTHAFESYLLIDRASYSASSYMASMCKELDSFTLIGQETGGGAGGNMGRELTNGWTVAVSVSDYVDSNYKSIEPGVHPDISVANTPAASEAGKDLVLDYLLGNL